MAQKVKATKQQTTKEEKQLYGLYVMIHPSSDETSVQKLHTALCDIVKQQADVKESKECTKQELSFPIQNANYAYTATIYFASDPNNIATIADAVKMVDGPLMRHILTKESHIPSAESAFVMPKEKEPDPNAPTDQAPSAPQDQSTTPTPPQDKSKITIEDIDKKLDEIMGNV